MRLIDVKSMKTICYFPEKVYFEDAVIASGMKLYIKNDCFNPYCYYKDIDGEMHNLEDLLLVDQLHHKKFKNTHVHELWGDMK